MLIKNPSTNLNIGGSANNSFLPLNNSIKSLLNGFLIMDMINADIVDDSDPWGDVNDDPDCLWLWL